MKRGMFHIFGSLRKFENSKLVPFDGFWIWGLGITSSKAQGLLPAQSWGYCWYYPGDRGAWD